MEQKTIILCPNPDRDRGMKATTTAIQLLQSVGFKTVVCSPFRDPKAGAFGNLPVKPILPELKKQGYQFVTYSTLMKYEKDYLLKLDAGYGVPEAYANGH